MTATYLHMIQSVNVAEGATGLITVGPAASAWWTVTAVKITVDFSAVFPNRVQTGGHVITSLFLGAPNATDVQSRVDNTFLFNDTSAILAAAIVFPGQYVTAQFANTSNLASCICTIEIYGVQYDTPPTIEATPGIAGKGFRGGLLSGADLAPTEIVTATIANPGSNGVVVIRPGMLNPVSLYSLAVLWIGTEPGTATFLGHWALQDHVTGHVFKELFADMGTNVGNTAQGMPSPNVDFGGITIDELAYNQTASTSGLIDFVFIQDQGTQPASTQFCLVTLTYSQGLPIPLY